MSAALLVIDVQESFRAASYWGENDLDAYLLAQNRLIDGARAAGVPVVRVFHVNPGDQGPFAKASGLVVPLAGSDPGFDYMVEKNVHSAMVGTALPRWLEEHKIDHLIISGIRTEQCCETTTRNASDMGWTVDYVTEATLTFPMVHANGRRYEPQDIKERTELVLAGRFATIRTVDEVLATLPVAA
jgi:nicotinamidase-related amidase